MNRWKNNYSNPGSFFFVISCRNPGLKQSNQILYRDLTLLPWVYDYITMDREETRDKYCVVRYEKRYIQVSLN